MSKQIIIVRPKAFSSTDKAKLTKEGNVVVEHENPASIIYKQPEEYLPYVYTCCANCGERIYMLKERMNALKEGKATFYCSHGHGQSYK